MKHKCLSLCLALLLLAALPLTALAQPFDYSQTGSISVTLVSPTPEQPMAGAELSVFHVADAGINSYGNLNYIYTEPFASCGHSLDDPDLVSKLDAFVSARQIPGRKMVTDAQGNALWTELPLGLYLVKQTGAAEGFAPCDPFLVTVPMETDEDYQYHVNASPKTDVVRLTDITVKKVWNTGKTAGLPDSVTVQLLRGDEVLETALLNARNNWQITYQNLPERDDYSIKEVAVPKGYTATYSRSGYVFTVTNTPTLAQTGQLVWPIPVFSMAGMILLLAGALLLRKPEEQDA